MNEEEENDEETEDGRKGAGNKKQKRPYDITDHRQVEKESEDVLDRKGKDSKTDGSGMSRGRIWNADVRREYEKELR